MASDLHLITIWAKHEEGWGYSGTPQFVAAFPTSLADAMEDVYWHWLKIACDNHRVEVEAPVIAFYEARTSIDRPSWDTLGIVEDDAVNPDWEEAQGAS